MKRIVYPTKTMLNLMIKDRPKYYYRKIIIGTLLASIMIAVFTKFAVLDRISYAYSLQRAAINERARYEKLAESNAVYYDVRYEYEKYFKDPSNGGYADIIDATAIIEQILMPNAAVQSASLRQNVLSVILTGIDLEQASAIVRELYTNELVESASVSSADTTTIGAESSVSMTITLNAEGAGR